jgi:hypothetical protein
MKQHRRCLEENNGKYIQLYWLGPTVGTHAGIGPMPTFFLPILVASLKTALC